MKELPRLVLLSIVFGLLTLPLSQINLSNETFALNAPKNFLGLPGVASIIVVPTDYPKIQDAIDAAKAGDTIKVLPGTFTEQLSIGKNINLIGSGAISTIIKAPSILNNNVLGRPYIVDINSNAKVTMKGFTIKGPDGTTCPRLLGVSVLEDASLNLNSASIKGCVQTGLLVGAGPQIGHAIVINTNIIDYRNAGIFAFGSGSTLIVRSSNIVAAKDSEVSGQGGIEVLIGAKGIIDNNKISGNICNTDECGPNFFTQTQGSGINVFDGATGTTVSNNVVVNNDLGIAIGENSKCCKVFNNVLKDNRFFGMTLANGEHTSSQDKITGGSVGVAAIADSVDTVARLVNDKVKNTDIPYQELTCNDFTAKIIVIPPKSIHPDQVECE